jgi:GAF domain-containing protein/HAMP domain-containing protein
MSIALRLRIIMVLGVTLLLLLVGIWSLYTLQQASELAIAQTEKSLTEAGETAILEAAKSTARQIDLFLDRQPEIALTREGMDTLAANAALGEIAIQPVGQTGYTALFDDHAITHFHINPGLVGVDLSTLADDLPEFWAILRASLGGSPSAGYYDWQDADGQIRPKYMSIVSVGNTPLRVAATTYIDEFYHPIATSKTQLANIQKTARIQLLLALVGVGLVVAYGASHVAKQFTQPIRRIAKAATRVSDGDLSPIDLEERKDEIGALAGAFNSMTAQLSDLINRLTARTDELTQQAKDLEESNRQSQRRAAQFEASAQVARAVASVLDPDQLLHQVVHLISDHFGHYHTGIFLLDDTPTGRWAVLKAANSAGGQRMLARGHQLQVGAQGIVGYVTNTGHPRVAHNVGADAIHFDNPDLPATRSELALPLIARGQIIGALDVQSTEEAAFDEEDVAVLRVLADQIAIALDNARLYEAGQAALAQVQVAQRKYVSEIWGELGNQRRTDFYEYGQVGVKSTNDGHRAMAEKVVTEGTTAISAGDDSHPAALVAPIKLRGQVIGALGLQEADADSGRVWGVDDIALVETIADQVAQAMEAAHLLDETQRNAQREQLVSEVSGRIRSAPSIDEIMRTAVQEIRKVLGVSHGAIRLGTENHLRPPENGVENQGPENSGDSTLR